MANEVRGMIHYHGTPIGGPHQDVIRFLRGRHALVPFPRQDHLGAVADVCKSFVFDNGAFSVWRSGKVLDVQGFTHWVREWMLHPGFAWALIPDVIEGLEQENDKLIEQWCDDGMKKVGVPVWHLHESLARLERLIDGWPIIALGSSGQWATPGTATWWTRIEDAMKVICDTEGKPKVKLHGLRMLSPAVFTRLPLASADSTNAAVNSGSLMRFGQYLPPNAWQRAAVIADRIESENSAPIWQASTQEALW
jgi:hypothetical protein